MKSSLRTFYILVVTQTFSLIGSRMTALAIGIKVFKDTGAATPLALTGFFGALPALVSASFAGVLADRWDRRYVMALADTGQAVGTLVLLISIASGAFQVWHLYIVALIQAVFGAFQGPAFGASVTMLVPDEHRNRTNAILQLIGPTSGIIAPVLAGLTFAFIGVTGVMTFDLFTFAVAVIVVLLVFIPRPAQSSEGRAMRGSIWKEIPVGFRFLISRPSLLAIILFCMAANFLLTGAFALNTPYVLSITGKETILGTLLSVMSLGGILGGIVMSAWGGTRPRIHTVMPGVMVMASALAVYGMSRSPITMGATLFVLMFPMAMVNASLVSIMQIKVPPDLQGRVFAAVDQLAMLLTPLALLMIGPLADHVFEPAVGGNHWNWVSPLVGSQEGSGMGLIMVIAGSALVIVALISYALPRIRHLEALLPDYAPVAAEEASSAVGAVEGETAAA